MIKYDNTNIIKKGNQNDCLFNWREFIEFS